MREYARNRMRERVWYPPAPVPVRQSYQSYSIRSAVGIIYRTEDEIQWIGCQAARRHWRILRNELAWIDRRRWDSTVDVEKVRAALEAALSFDHPLRPRPLFP